MVQGVDLIEAHRQFADGPFRTSTSKHRMAPHVITATRLVPIGASFNAQGCQDNRMVSMRRMPPCPLITGA